MPCGRCGRRDRDRLARRRRRSAAAWRRRRPRARRWCKAACWPRPSVPAARPIHWPCRSAPRGGRARPRRACDHAWPSPASTCGWPAARASHAGMEGSGVEGKGFHVEADIVAREQPAVAIEGRVLDGLGGDGRAQLLKARHGRACRRESRTGAGPRRQPSGRWRGRSCARRRPPAAAPCGRPARGRRRRRRCDRPGNAPAAR